MYLVSAYNLILFVKETNDHIAVWEGAKLSKAQAREQTGIQNIQWVSDFEKLLQFMAFEADGFYLGHNEHIKRLTNDQETRQDRMIQWCKKKYPLHDYHRAAKLTRELRQIKSNEEVRMMQKAVDISAASFKMVLEATKSGMMEYEIEAILTYNLIKSGGVRHAFKPIIASGGNGSVP